MKTPFKLRSGNTTPFKEMGSSPAKQKEFKKYNAAGQRVNMMGVPHGTPKSKLTDIGSLKSEHKGLYKQKSSMPKDFNTKGGPSKTPGYESTKAAKHKQSFDKFQAQKQKGKEFVKNLKTKKIPKMDMTLNKNLNKAVKKTAKKVTKKAVKKGALQIAKQVGKRLLGPVGVALTAYDVVKTIPKVVKATKKSLKKEAKTGSTVGKPKY